MSIETAFRVRSIPAIHRSPKPNIDIDKIEGFTVASAHLNSQTLIKLVKKVPVAIRQIA